MYGTIQTSASETGLDLLRAHVGGDEAATLRLFRAFGPWRFGSLLWMKEELLGARCAEWKVRGDRTAHPVVSLAAKAPESLDEPIPVLAGTSTGGRKEFFSVSGVTDDGRVTRFVPYALAWVTPRELLWRDPACKDLMEGWPWEVRRAWPNATLPRLSAANREALRAYLGGNWLFAAAVRANAAA
ncbi:MAG: hypothetical protein IJV65_04830 [Kiritimatiellae bacterium]|nr:hypothetical protein [Kiritimatiellia bacterium]